ncbi:MAG: RraA family protein [Vicinamibacteraceae bacterium]
MNLTASAKCCTLVMAGLCLALPRSLEAQTIPKEQLIAMTAEWKGPRFPDGRPKVADEILKRMEHVTIEEAWATLRGQKYTTQYEDGDEFEQGRWEILHPDRAIVGRALTATYAPARPDVQQYIDRQGKQAERSGPPNTWPIDMLQPGDVYVADGFGKIADGTLIGDRLGNTIYANSGNGVVFDGSARDLEGLQEIEGFNAFLRAWHPSYIQSMMLVGLNTPTRIGSVTAMPGDVVLAKREGVVFIPAHLAEQVVSESERTRVQDAFAHTMVANGTYTAGQMDMQWTEEIQKSFVSWVQSNGDRLQKELGVARETIDALVQGQP